MLQYIISVVFLYLKYIFMIFFLFSASASRKTTNVNYGRFSEGQPVLATLVQSDVLNVNTGAVFIYIS